MTNKAPWPPPPANREKRRSCKHPLAKTVNKITACVECGTILGW